MPDETPEVPQPTDPYQFLSQVANAPTKEQVNLWKSVSCNGRIKLFTPDGSNKRVFILRPLSAREMETVQNAISETVLPNKVEQELMRGAVITACNWTNTTSTGKLDDMALRNAPAGLLGALYELVCQLSDFLPPAALQTLSADL